MKTKKKNFIYKANAGNNTRNIIVLKKYVNLDTGELFLKLKFTHTASYFTEKTLPRADVYKKDGKELIKHGANVQKLSDTLSDIEKQEELLDFNYTHEFLGWNKVNECVTFFHFGATPLNSRYTGKFDINPKGSYEAWLLTVTKYAMPQTPLQFAIILGLSSVLVGYLKEELDGSLFFHLYGDSSKGKTTFAMLAVSTAGNPSTTGQNTLMCDWSDTPNYKISSLANNYGFPIVYDEFSLCTQRDVSDFCYNVANGRDRGRLNASANRRSVSTWSTTIISTGESSLLSRCNNNAGLLVRILDLSLESITESADSAEKLKTGILQNYGFANAKLAEYIIQHEAVIAEKFLSWRRQILSAIGIQSSLIERLSKRLAVIMLTAELSAEALELDFDIKGILQILADGVIAQNEQNSFNRVDTLLQLLLEDMTANAQYYKKHSEHCDNNLTQGSLTAIIKNVRLTTLQSGQPCNTELIYLPTKFEEILSRYDFTDKIICLNSLKMSGYLIHDKGRYTTKRKVGNKSPRCYVVKFPLSMINSSEGSVA